MRPSLLIYNPAAGQRWRRPAPEAVVDELARNGWRAELHLTRGQDHATELVRAHLAPRHQAVWSAGGDGTLGQCAAALIASQVPLGIIPTGTVNVIARECGLPSSWRRAFAAVADAAHTRPFRTWRAGERAVLLGIGVGFDARAMGRVSAGAKDALGMLAIGTRGVREWARYDFPPLRVTGQDEHGRPIDLDATQVLATVPRHFAGQHVLVADANPADAFIDLVLFRGTSRARLAAFWVGVELPGTAQLRVPGVQTLRARRFSVAATDGRAEPTHVNGDVVDSTPLSVEPWGTVQILAPDRV
ncbi:diacylglycerol/lipid kinase family protein [Longimicrobium sp.]|uniref:diacylglycerol/lipid kinase family protein n=1 Tax=Longimicrobium sp. TaxID=2029185 RepID=UPI003B3B4DE9